MGRAPMTPTQTPSDRTLAEMAAGKKAVFYASWDDTVGQLKAAGLKEIPTDPVLLAFHLEMAKASGAVKPLEQPGYVCQICGKPHAHRQRCAEMR